MTSLLVSAVGEAQQAHLENAAAGTPIFVFGDPISHFGDFAGAPTSYPRIICFALVGSRWLTHPPHSRNCSVGASGKLGGARAGGLIQVRNDEGCYSNHEVRMYNTEYMIQRLCVVTCVHHLSACDPAENRFWCVGYGASSCRVRFTPAWTYSGCFASSPQQLFVNLPISQKAQTFTACKN